MQRTHTPINYPQAIYFNIFEGVNIFSCIPHMPIGALIASVMAQRYGFDLVVLGASLGFLTVCDAIWDPAIGVASDTWKTKWGYRRPWLIIGTIATVLSGLVLFFPRAEMSLLFFLPAYAAFNFCGSLFQVPYMAMATAVTHDVRSRDKLYFTRAIVASAFGVGFALLPQLPFFETTELTVEVFTLSIMIFAVLSAPALGLLFRSFPENKFMRGPGRRGQQDMKLVETLSNTLKLLKSNPPFRFFIIVSFTQGIGVTTALGLSFFWFDGYLGLGAYISILLLLMSLIGLLAPLVGLWLTTRFSRMRIYAYAALLQAGTSVMAFFLTPETPGLLYIYFVQVILSTGIGFIAVAIGSSIIADTVDYGRLKTGLEGAGLYTTAYRLVFKFQATLFASLGMIIVGLFGYQPGAESQPEAAIWGLRIAVGAIPVIFFFLAGLLMFWYPLNKHRTEIVIRRLAIQDARAQHNS